MSYIVEKSPLKDGTKVYRLYQHYTDPLTGKKHIASVKLKSKSRQAVNAAQRKLDAVVVQKLSGTIPGVPGSTVTLRALCDLWLIRQKKDNRTKSTITRNRWASNMLCDLIGGTKLIDKFTAPMIKRALEDDNPSPGKYNERLTRFRALIHFAFDEELVENINYLGKLKKKNKGERKMKNTNINTISNTINNTTTANSKGEKTMTNTIKNIENIRYMVGVDTVGANIFCMITDDGRKFVYWDQGKYTKIRSRFDSDEEFAAYQAELIAEREDWDETSEGWDEITGEDIYDYIDVFKPFIEM